MYSEPDGFKPIDLDELEESVGCACTAGDDNPY